MKSLALSLLIVLLFGSTGSSVSAAQLSVETPLAAAGTTFALPVVFTADTQSVNVVEGIIAVPEGVAIERIDTSGSAFPLFASGPTYVLSSHTVEFTAGAPEGITAGDTALLFVLYARTDTPASYPFIPSSVVAYANDGSGSPLAVTARTGTVSVGEKGSVHVDALPTATPQALVAELGTDESLFEGRWFATFYGGGATQYEVREGWWRLPEHADRYYVLKDQDLRTSIWVTAVGEQGERTTVRIPATHPWTERAVLLALSLLAAFCAYRAWRMLRRRS